MDELINGLDSFIDQVDSVSARLTTEEKAEITLAGAKVFKDELVEVTKAKDFKYVAKDKDLNLVNNIAVQNKNLDKVMDGQSNVNFGDMSHVARFINDGTRFPLVTSKGNTHRYAGRQAITGDSFVDNVRNDDNINRKMVQAEYEAYQKIIERKVGK